MANMSLENISNTYMDVLKELGNIGAGNAMTALSQMLNCKVDMRVPQIKLMEFSEIGAMLGGEEQYLVGLLDHDGRPNVNYREYAEIARDIRKLEPYAFPYLPVPEIAVAYSFDSDMVAYYGKYQYHHSRCS